MGTLYWLTLEAFTLRVKDLKISDDEAAEMWARMSDPDCIEADADRERLWGKDLNLFSDYIDKAIEARKRGEIV